MKYTSVVCYMQASIQNDGVWRSLVARVLWEHEAGGSSPLTPTNVLQCSGGFAVSSNHCLSVAGLVKITKLITVAEGFILNS